MKVTATNNQYSVDNWGTNSKKVNNVREYSNYLKGKYRCLTPCKNASVSVTSGLLRKAMGDDKTGEWLERELGKVTDYIRAAQKAAIAHGSTLKSVSIEFGEEYSTMTTTGVFDGGGTDSEIDEWLARIEEKKSEKKANEKKLDQANIESDQDTFSMEMRGKSLEDLTGDFVMKLSLQSKGRSGSFDVKG